MTLWQTIRVAVHALLRNKLRSFLTTLGIGEPTFRRHSSGETGTPHTKKGIPRAIRSFGRMDFPGGRNSIGRAWWRNARHPVSFSTVVLSLF